MHKDMHIEKAERLFTKLLKAILMKYHMVFTFIFLHHVFIFHFQRAYNPSSEKLLLIFKGHFLNLNPQMGNLFTYSFNNHLANFQEPIALYQEVFCVLPLHSY